MKEKTETDPLSLCRLWLNDYEKCCRNRNYEGARKLFHEKVILIGTHSDSCTSIDEAINQEWQWEWPKQIAFTFDIGSAKIVPGQGFYVLALPWESRPVIIGPPTNYGRATIVLAQFEDGTLKCLHMHTSESVKRIES